MEGLWFWTFPGLDKQEKWKLVWNNTCPRLFPLLNDEFFKKKRKHPSGCFYRKVWKKCGMSIIRGMESRAFSPPFEGVLHGNTGNSVFLEFEDLNPRLALEEPTCVCSCALQLRPCGRHTLELEP